MNYAQLLDQTITESGLSLRQIVKACADLGLSITPSYISQLKNAKLPPPNPDVTSVLARVCKSRNESRLIFQGYIEKAPDVIKEYMSASSQLNKIMLESLCEMQGNLELTSSAKQFLEELDIVSTIQLTDRCIKSQSAGSQSDISEQISLAASSLKTESKNTVSFIMPDDSMEPAIPKKSVLTISIIPAATLKSKEIIAFTRGLRTMVRRIFFMGDEILLVPEHKSEDIYRINSFEDIDYIGKVSSYRVDF